MNDEPRRRRAGGRAARIAIRRAPLEADQRAVRPGLSGGRFRPLADSELQQVYDTALGLLEDIGMGSPVPEFVEVVTEAGGFIDDDERLRFPRGIVEQAIQTAAKSGSGMASTTTSRSRWAATRSTSVRLAQRS